MEECLQFKVAANLSFTSDQASPRSTLVRKHVPDSDPRCALQSTSEPALHRRNVPNCRPMVNGAMRKCSAGACPPLGSGWGVAVPRHNSGPSKFVIPAKAGIHALKSRERAPTAIPPPTSTRRPQFVFPAIARPVPRYGAGIQGAERRHKCLSKNTNNRRTDFHTLVCRWQPA